MYEIKNILVPVDLSQTSLNAMESASYLAGRHSANISIIFVRDNTLDFIYENYHPAYSFEQAADILQAHANSLINKYGINIKVVLKEGNVIAEILREAAQINCDLVVIGAHGASGYRDCFIGSNAYNVIKLAHCPVLTVPNKRQFIQFRNVLFPIRPVSGALFNYNVVREMLTSEVSTLNILGLSYLKMERGEDLLEEIKNEVREELNKDRIVAKTAWGKGNGIPEDVLYAAMVNQADMIVVTSFIDVSNKPFFIGPNAQRIISNARIPVLTIRKMPVLSLS